MSFSVDDLVNSLGASHIGQEAIDLAALQAQLAAALFPVLSSRATASHHQHSNTPLARTPSNSISMGSMSIDMAMSMRTSANSRRGSCSMPLQTSHGHVHPHSRNDTPMSPTSAYHHYHHHPRTSAFDDTLEEDERMVEELLLPPPNPTPSSISPSPSFHHEACSFLSSPSTTSSFTTSDPFYLSQLQASQQAFAPNPATAQSLFAQNGRITPGSQFALHTAF